MKLPENTGINEHAIGLKKYKQPSFESIYSLGPIELETLKTYIKNNHANSFIYFLKSTTSTLILFD